MAPGADGLPARHHGAAVFPRLARRRDVAADQPPSAGGCPRGDGSRGDGPRGRSLGRGDRPPVGHDHRGRRAARRRRRHDDPGPQAPHSDRYRRVAGRSDGARGRHPRPRRGGPLAGLAPQGVSPSMAPARHRSATRTGSTPLAARPAPSARPPWRRSAPGPWRSASARMSPGGSRCCRGACQLSCSAASSYLCAGWQEDNQLIG